MPDRADRRPGRAGAREGAPYHVDAPEKTPQHTAILGPCQLRPAPPAGRKNGEPIATGLQQCLAVDHQGRDHRDLPLCQFQGKSVLLEDGRVTPSAGTIKLGDHRSALLHAHLVDPVLVAVEREQPTVGDKSGRFHCVQDGIRVQVIVGDGISHGRHYGSTGPGRAPLRVTIVVTPCPVLSWVPGPACARTAADQKM